MMPTNQPPMPPTSPGGSPMPPENMPASQGAPAGLPDLDPEQAKQLIAQAAGTLMKLADKYGVDLQAIIADGGSPDEAPPPAA